MSAYDNRRATEEVSGWASAGLAFAAAMLILIGIFQLILGLTGIVDDEFYVLTENYTFDIDTTVWGVIHLLIGLGLIAIGVGLISGSTWAATGAIVIAGLSAIANFLFIPYYPYWSILVIALDVWVIWSLTRRRVLDA